MMERFFWAILAMVHIAPAAALVRPGLITRLYGVAQDAPTFLLLQHRAALFACVFLVCGWAIFDPGVRRLAVVVAAVSMIAFLVLYRLGGSPATLQVIALTDFAALPVLAASAYLAWKS